MWVCISDYLTNMNCACVDRLHLQKLIHTDLLYSSPRLETGFNSFHTDAYWIAKVGYKPILALDVSTQKHVLF